MTGKKIYLDIINTSTIKFLKEKIQKETDLDLSQLKLIYKGKVLKDDFELKPTS